MSELDVDGVLLANTDVVEENKNILESIHACVLSSIKGIEKLDEALEKLLLNQTPELIIIETSGSSHPMPLVEYFKSHNELKLTGVFALVDSLMLAHDYNYGERLIPKLQENHAKGKRDTSNLLVEQILFCRKKLREGHRRHSHSHQDGFELFLARGAPIHLASV